VSEKISSGDGADELPLRSFPVQRLIFSNEFLRWTSEEN
jgi:hypothetical protein